jgi:hypothetical protein
MPVYIVTLIIEVACIVHIMRTGRERYWIYIVFFVPMAGVVAYLLVEVLPDLLRTRTARRLNRQATSWVDPGRGVRARRAELERADTVENRRRLAEEHLERGDFAEALALYEGALVGMHADDKALLMGAARARFGLDDFAGALAALDQLQAAHPSFASGEAHLIYARCLEALGRDDDAAAEYRALIGYAVGEEARCRYAQLLQRRGDSVAARQLFGDVVKNSRLGTPRYRREQQAWIGIAEQALAGN